MCYDVFVLEKGVECMQVFDYEDIQLIPSKCIVKSRSECDTSIEFGKFRFKLPVVPANMATIIDETLAKWLAKNGYFYIMHRFEEEKRIPFMQDMIKEGFKYYNATKDDDYDDDD